MSDQASGKGVQEVQGIFPSDAALQDAIAKLTHAGFDRASLSLPATQPPANVATPNQGAADPMTDTDLRQARTLGTSMAGYAGAFAAAGATIATGGAAGVAIAAAAAAGVGSAMAANAVGTTAKHEKEGDREEAAQAGRLVLAVHADTADQQESAGRIMRQSGATDVATILRASDAGSGVDSASWTG